MLSADLTAALKSASASYAYTRVLHPVEGAITVFLAAAVGAGELPAA
jgi:dihydroxyacetone kinase-like predicted kinase